LSSDNNESTSNVREYNPAQQQVLELLGRTETGESPTFSPGLAAELHDELSEAVEPLAERMGDETIFISKHALSGLHGCEVNHVATRGNFAWSIPNARGTVAHKAIELAIHWQGEPAPRELVDEAMARLSNDDKGMALFLQSLDDADRSQMRGECTDLVSKFEESFPAIQSNWRPVTESKSVVEFLDGRVRLTGKVDLTLGRFDPLVPRKVIIDLKTGMPRTQHREDLRFYALVETLKLGTPPRLIATYYLDTARPHPETVTEAVLRSAMARTIDGIVKEVELREGRPPQTQPGPACRWCPIADDCATGLAHLAAQAEQDGW
jgi:CRISPR/Cas system-associated exonuclease Cas4 (RecB family)